MPMNRRLLISLLSLALAACDSGGGDGSGGGSTSGGTGDPTTSSTTGSTTDDSTTTGEPGTSSGGESSSSSGGESSSSGFAGSSSGGESSSSTGAQTGLPDLDLNDPQVISDTQESIYIQTLDFSESSCAWQDGCLAGTGSRRLLRFDTITPNLGDADFYAGNETINPELFEYSDCQQTYLLADYAQYRLLDGKGNVVANGHKAAFALIDLAPWVPGAGPSQYGFNDMGISVGWADIYGAGLACQWVDITDVPAGEYVLELSINPEHSIEESNFDNNILQLPVTVTPAAGGDWNCNPSWFGGDDGCDCGCGLVDPDCGGMTSDLCDTCLGGSCASASCAEIDPTNNAVCQ